MLDFLKKKPKPAPGKSGDIPARLAYLLKPGQIHDDYQAGQKELVDFVVASGTDGVETFRLCLEDAFAMRAGTFRDIWPAALDIAKLTLNPQMFRTIEKVTKQGRDLVMGSPNPPHWMPDLETDIIGDGKFGWHDGIWKPIAHDGVEFLAENIPSLPPNIRLEHQAAASDACTYHISRWEGVKKSGQYQSLLRLEEEIAYWTAMKVCFQAGGDLHQPSGTSTPPMKREGIPFPGIITDIITDFDRNALDSAIIVSVFDDYIRESLQHARPDIRIHCFGGSRDEQQRWAQFLSGTGGEKFSLADRSAIFAREGLVMGSRDAQIFLGMLTEVRGRHVGLYLFYEYSRDTYKELESMFSRSRSGNLKINVYGIDGLLYSRRGCPDPSLKKATCGYMGLLSNDPECDACTFRAECRNNKARWKVRWGEGNR